MKEQMRSRKEKEGVLYKMFYGQNCSGRLGERKAVICVVACKEDWKFARLIKELNLKNIKKDLDEKHFFKALEIAKNLGIAVSIIVIETNWFKLWKDKLVNYPHWFAKLYGIICYHAIKPILEKGYLQMDREYDDKTLDTSAKSILQLTNNLLEIYTRKEREYSTNRIIVADLFARGYFKGFRCQGVIINKKLKIDDEIKKLFKNR
jgi:hypothetical protein